MEHPILVDGEKRGELTVSREGLYTVFEAKLPDSGDLTRLWIAGEGRSAYLGIMEPKGGELYLRRRLSAAELRKLPENIEYACTAEPAIEAPPAEPAHQESGDKDGSSPEAGGTGPPEEHAEALEATQSEEDDEPEEPEPEPEPESGDAEEDRGLLWFRRPDGSMTAFDGRQRFLALPAQLRREAPGARLMRLNGGDYMVFRY